MQKFSAATHRETCRVCDGRNLIRALPLEATPVGDAYLPGNRLDEPVGIHPLDLYVCRDCGLAQLLDVINPEILYGNFIYETSVSLGLVEHFEKYAGDVLDRIGPQKGALVVDIGSNDGTLLRFFQKRGMSVLGLDPAKEIAQKATDLGIETLPLFFDFAEAERIRADRGPAAIVTSNNTLANVDDLGDLIAGIRCLLGGDGVFVFETGYVSDLLQKGLFDTVYHEHLSYFAVKSLDVCFSRHGLELIDVERISSKGGSLRGYVQPAGGPRPISGTVAQMIEKEERLGINRIDPFERFADKISDTKIQLNSLLDELKKEEKNVAGYGASVGSTTFLFHFELGERLDFLVDDNPAKHNLFSPGHHIPVLPSRALCERKPEYVLILAWRYAEAITMKHQAYLEQGGRFIVPWPTLKVL